MNSQAIMPDLNLVPLRDGVRAVLENSQFGVTPISDEHNQGLRVPVDFVATSNNGVRFVVKCHSNPSNFEPAALQSLVDFSKGHGITEVMIIGDGEFPPAIIESAATFSVRLTNREAYRMALSNVPPEVIQRLLGEANPPGPAASIVEEKPYVVKSAFDNPVSSGGSPNRMPLPLPGRAHGTHGGASPEMIRMESDLREAVPRKKASLSDAIARPIAIVVLLGIICVGYKASMAGLEQLSFAAKEAKEAAAALEAPSLKEVVENTIIETRKTSGLSTVEFDQELIGLMEPAVDALTISGRQPSMKMFERIIGAADPGFRIGSSMLFTGEKPEELASKVKSWSPLIDRPDDEFGSLSKKLEDGKVWTWVYHGTRISRKKQLDDALRHGGNFVLKCGHCSQESAFQLTAHAKFFVNPECSHCGLIAHAFGPDTQGDYLRACDFLTGFKIPEDVVAKFLPENPAARTPKNEILAHWSAILDRCDYEYDTRQKGAGSRDVWKLPQQTWDERVGDCEDTSILLADALISAGYDARVALGHWQGGGHAWCVVKAEGRQWILETTQPMTGAASLRSMIKVGSDYVVMCTFNRDSIFLRRNAAHLSTMDYFSDNYWLTLNLKDVEGEESEEEFAQQRVAE